MKIAIVHDWLVTYAGAEKVLEQLLKLYPEADIFTIVDFLPKRDRAFLTGHKIMTSFIQSLPFAKTKYRNYLPLMPLAIEQFDVSIYDLVISSSHAIAKGIITGPNQKHICMCYSPIRYAWDLQHQYLKESGLDKGLKGWFAKYFLYKMRIWDSRTSNGVDQFIAISEFIQRRILKVYRRESTVIYPPVDVDSFELCTQKEDFYLTASRMVPYKKIDLIVEAFGQMPDKKLIVIGDGPDMAKIKAKAGANVVLLGYQPFDILKEHMQKAKAFIFAAEEDFGITPVEAQACGTPIIAYGKGGARETVVENETGLFFEEQTIHCLCAALHRFEAKEWNHATIRQHSLHFSTQRFLDEVTSYINNSMK
ncbi:glycosyltransferase family 4 protein [Sulfurospirillum diekertiae]|uniref:GDP-mannose-dependent alpha-(1-6)-phosphatidylinositol monomannoside mannosyltransferase n=1 Tax=Sulfurospirillum diekertiae TaxID=1854492 RepID=A0A1Y0HPM6_9BACT|nr:glycosyltransferase family 4 protein [Sulfurospirillum diekertiae]ARU49506.1 GDP-mannose-dependent alpha-(1-6)-phosphatidylinositol monomannoside mannosyltransferase [Sulfurospirillum diekertiae]ASC94311.1 GDP-mannose-dependent alpha-(1-6)-phosphatidylinositol monomannoside mannosyltransferase [Sulfurospirillum diekertiae]